MWHSGRTRVGFGRFQASPEAQLTASGYGKECNLIMAGASFQVQIRHILVDEKEVADLLAETIQAANPGVAQVQLLMKLAGKYSICPSKDDGGNLGWIEMGWNSADPRQPRGGFKKLKNEELYDLICKGLDKMEIEKGIVYGPVQTKEGSHVLIIANEFKTDRIL